MSLFSARNLPKVGLYCIRCSTAFPIKPAWNPVTGPDSMNCRPVTTDTRGLGISEGGILKRAVGKVKDSLFRQKLKLGGHQLYETVADKLDYATFMTELKMPDTFHSWFMVTELHLWMLSVRLMADPSGRNIRNYLLEALWKDVNSRISKLGVEHTITARGQVSSLAEELQASLVTYDEGLMDDKTLASAIWRRLLGRSPDTSPHHLGALVSYVRAMLCALDRLSIEDLVIKREVEWIPAKKLFEVKL